MRRLWLAGLVALTQACASTPARLFITNVGVVDVDSGVVHPGRTVVVSGRRIERVAPAEQVRTPRGAQVLDGRGRFLIPGLWDAHVHSDPPALAALLAHGVTGARDMGGDFDSLTAWHSRIRAGAMAGPRLWFAGAALHGPDGNPGIDAGTVRTPAEGAHAVDSLAALGADFIKAWEGIPRAAFFAVARQARARGIPLVGHVPAGVTPAEVSDSGQAGIEHLEFVPDPCLVLFDAQALAAGTAPPPGCGPAAMDSLLRRLARNGTALDPTISSFRRWAPAAFEPGIMAGFRRLVPLIRASGVAVLAGSDLGTTGIAPGASLHDELALLVSAGFSPAEALRAATAGPARFLGADSLGAVRAGRLADLVLLEGDPLADIRNTRRIVAVVFDGRLLSASSIDSRSRQRP